MSSQQKDRSLLPLDLYNSSSLSPTSNVSPVTDLAHNLIGLTTDSLIGTPKRRISWSSGTPSRPRMLSIAALQGLMDSPLVDSPMFQERLLRDAVVDNVHNRGLLRRIRPCQTRSQLGDKENIPCQPATSPTTAQGVKCQLSVDALSDTDSQDSGYSDIGRKLGKAERHDSPFTEPSGLPPRRAKLGLAESPSKASVLSGSISLGSSPRSISTDSFSSLSQDEADDGFLEIFEMEKMDEDMQVPSSIAGLLTASLSCRQEYITDNSQFGDASQTDSSARPVMRRCLSVIPEQEYRLHKASQNDRDFQASQYPLFRPHLPPSMDNNNSCHRALENDENESGKEKLPFKRPDPPKDLMSPIHNKRHKSVSFGGLETSPKLGIQRCHSESEATIKRALLKSSEDPDLIGDFTKPFALPLVTGKHQDIKAISANTMAKLIKGHYGEVVKAFSIVDCRYPYEYEGGHIVGALNIYTKEGIIREFLSNPQQPKETNERHIIVFHCEFSSERGPSLYRFLRNKDRETNTDGYPALHHPETYVLSGGYKAFYEQHRELCEPPEYKPMLHKDHEQDLRHFKAKSKSWNGDTKTRVAVRSGLKF